MGNPTARQATVLAGRFRLEELARAGGMGRVFHAFDLQRQVPVAVKLMHEQLDSAEVARFSREAEVLAQLDHPGIVSYVAHGQSEQGEPFLVMEWLDGEDLAQRLRRNSLTAQESCVLVRRVAVALQSAHARNVVHRDLKPANLFLRDGDVGRVTVVDFGIARQFGVMPSITRAGGLLGTPGYIAPEQARGLKSVGAPADLFALGSVWFECLTGRPPFAAGHIAEALARVLFDPPPKLETVRPDLPKELSQLMASLLAKDPDLRLQTARQLVEEIDALPALIETSGPIRVDVRSGLGALEQRLVNVLIAKPRGAAIDLATLDANTQTVELPSLTAALIQRGARVEMLGDGSLVATLALAECSAVDQAVQAVEMARLIHDRWPDTVVALATGLGLLSGRHPLGEALTRAGELLPQAETLGAEHPAAHILVEDVTAGLLASRVRTVRLASGISTIHDGSVTADASRPLLGKPTPCLGREQELGTLEMAWRAAVDQGEAKAVLVLGPPGIGKSRIRHEFLRRVMAAAPQATVITGRAEAGQAASAYAVLATALRGLCLSSPAEPLEQQRFQLQARLGEHVDPAQRSRIVEFLGELAGVAFDDKDSVKLRSARQDPRILRDQIGAAWLDFLRAQCAVQPVLLLLEDLHWGDRASADLVELALRELQDLPLLVVALARPEISEHLPGFCKGRAQELPLRPLGRRACEQLVQQVLGPGVAPELVARIVEQAAGNALFLEELIRAAANGKADRLPPTVLAMLQARIGGLDPGLRRALRAASVFGESFFLTGTHALLGPPTTLEEAKGWTEELQRQEIIDSRHDAVQDHEIPLRFRHALMREAAYSLLTEEDRTLGHRLAALFLEGSKADPAVIADHWQRAGQREQAVVWYIQAAERAYERDDHASCGALATKALACEPSGESLGVLLAMDGDARVWQWDWKRAFSDFEQAIALLEPGSNWWCRSVQGQGTLIAYRGTTDNDLVGLCQQFMSITPLPNAELAYASCAANIASGCTQVGLTELGRTLMQLAEAVIPTDDLRFPSVAAWRRLVYCTLHRHTHDDLAAQLQAAQDAVRLYLEGGATDMMVGVARDVLGEVLCRVGEIQPGIELLHDAIAGAQRRGLAYLVTHARQCLANSLIIAGEFAQAAEVAQALIATAGITAGFQAMARHVIAQSCLDAGDLPTALAEARTAIELSPHTPIRRLQMRATLVRILQQIGQLTEATATADAALEDLASYDGGGYAELALLLAAAHAFAAAQEPERAKAVIARARDKLLSDAEKFSDITARHRFLTAVPLHREISQFAGRLLA